MNIKLLAFIAVFLTSFTLSTAQAIPYQLSGTLDLYQNTNIIATEDISGSFSFAGTPFASGFSGDFSGKLIGLPITGNLNIENISASTVSSPFQFEWNNQFFSGDLYLDINIISPDLIQITSLDIDANGIPGLIIESGAKGITGIAFSGQLSAVPIPAAIWLFTSGLIGISGLALQRTRNRSTAL